MVRDDMAIAGILIVAVARLDPLTGLAPIRILPTPSANVRDERGDGAVPRNLRQADLEQMIDVAGDEGLRLHRRPELGGVDSCAVMADPRRLLGEARGEGRLARRDHGPSVDENLRADLLGDSAPIRRHRAARRRSEAALQIEPGGMLRRIAIAAPPEDRALLDNVIQPSLADFGCAEIGLGAVVLELANEGERPGNVVVRDDQRAVELVMDDRKSVV